MSALVTYAFMLLSQIRAPFVTPIKATGLNGTWLGDIPRNVYGADKYGRESRASANA